MTRAVRIAAPRSPSRASRTAPCAASSTAGRSTSAARSSTSPAEPAERERFGDKVKVRHYPRREAGGLIFVYVGEGEPTQFPSCPSRAIPTIIRRSCRFRSTATGSKGSKDKSILARRHLHSSSLNTAYPVLTPSLKMTRDYFLADTGPRFEINMTNYGLQAAAIRKVGEGNLFVRVTEFAMPYWTCIPNPGDGDFLMIGQVPVDDTHTTQWYVMHNPPPPDGPAGHRSRLPIDARLRRHLVREGRLAGEQLVADRAKSSAATSPVSRTSL